VIVLGVLGWSYGARQLRSQTLSLRRRDFLEAARVRGERNSYIIVNEILPTMTSLIVASFLGAAVYAVLFAAGLQFIGLGDPNSQSWGTMLYWAQNNEALGAGMPYWAIMPGVCVALLGAAFALVNYAFDEISNPALRLRRLEHKGAQELPSAPPAQVAADTENMLQVRGLTVAYASDAGPVVAVDNVDLDLKRGEFLGIVGESGCGKSTLLYAIARLLGAPLAGEITSGQVLFKGRDMVSLTEKQLRHIRWREYSVVMQSAMNALNPVLTVEAQMRDALEAHSDMTKREMRERSKEVLRLVSIDPVHLLSYPHQLSGGMRQRAMIAMALLFTPDLIIMDEPTSALDVVAQRSLMMQIKELQERLGFAVIFVTHDMSLVSHFSDRLLVMYAAQVAEYGKTRQLFGHPLHPYTQGLLEAFPSIRGEKARLTGIPGQPPDLLRPPAGCRFAARCPHAHERCAAAPPLYEVDGELVRCVLYEREREAVAAT
jgi:oligopeptide/dipeptide ABC transporter ATP-binding protein